MINFFLLLRTEWQLEWATGKRIMHFLGLGVLFSLLTALGLQAAFLSPQAVQRIFPSMLALLFLFCNLSASQEVLAAEMKHDVHESLRLFGISPSQLYSAKLVLSSGLSFLSGTLISLLLFAFLNLQGLPFLEFASLAFFSSFAFSSLAILVAGLSARSRASSLLFVIILLPLLAPVYFCCSELAMLALEAPELFFTSFWFSLLCGLAVIYSLLGSLLFEFTVFRPL